MTKELTIKLAGEVVESNLPEFKKDVLAMLDNVNMELETSDDFSKATDVVKNCKVAEKAIKKVKAEALKQTVDFEKLFSSLDEISTRVSSVRLALDKKIKTKKEDMKKAVIDDACLVVEREIKSLAKENDYLTVAASVDRKVFELAAKNKKKISAIETSVATAVSEAIEQVRVFDVKTKNIIELIATAEKDHPGLFPDKRDLVLKTRESVSLTIESRVANFKLAEKEKAEVLRKKKLAEEKAATTPKEQPKPDTPKPTVVTATPEKDPTTGRFIMAITLECETDEAKKIAKSVDQFISGNKSVVKIKLTRE